MTVLKGGAGGPVEPTKSPDLDLSLYVHDHSGLWKRLLFINRQIGNYWKNKTEEDSTFHQFIATLNDNGNRLTLVTLGKITVHSIYIVFYIGQMSKNAYKNFNYLSEVGTRDSRSTLVSVVNYSRWRATHG